MLSRRQLGGMLIATSGASSAIALGSLTGRAGAQGAEPKAAEDKPGAERIQSTDWRENYAYTLGLQAYIFGFPYVYLRAFDGIG